MYLKKTLSDNNYVQTKNNIITDDISIYSVTPDPVR